MPRPGASTHPYRLPHDLKYTLGTRGTQRHHRHPAAPSCGLLHPAGGHPEGLGLHTTGRTEQLSHSGGEVVVDDGLVEEVAVVELEPRGRVQHVTELVILRDGMGEVKMVNMVMTW